MISNQNNKMMPGKRSKTNEFDILKIRSKCYSKIEVILKLPFESKDE